MNDCIEAFKAQAEAQIGWCKAIADFRLKASQAAESEARAENDAALAQAKFAEVAQMHADFLQMQQRRRVVESNLIVITQRSADLAALLAGYNPQRAWIGWKFFTLRCSSDAREKLLEIPCRESNVFVIGETLRLQNVLPAVGSKTWEAFNKAVEIMAADAQRQVEAIQQSLRELETNTYTTWNPLTVLAIPPSRPATVAAGDDDGDGEQPTADAQQ